MKDYERLSYSMKALEIGKQPFENFFFENFRLKILLPTCKIVYNLKVESKMN